MADVNAAIADDRLALDLRAALAARYREIFHHNEHLWASPHGRVNRCYNEPVVANLTLRYDTDIQSPGRADGC
jgi:hypothetical protein